MATIQTAIAITDGATAPLQRMARAAEITTGRFEAASSAANKIDESVSRSVEQRVRGISVAANSTVPAFDAAAIAAETTAGRIGMIGSAAMAARVGVVGLAMTITAVLGSIVAIFGIIMAGLQAISGAFRLSDELSQTTARLNLMNDGLQTTAQLQAMIFASAQRSRSEYQATADFVAKIGMMAGKIFTSNAELIGVAETINKIFKISGTSAQEQASATLQLSQALASGVLRGEELNAVFEAAPMMIQKIADYLKVDIGQIREMAQDGQLSAEIVKNAMIAATAEVNKTFETIPKTWSDIWTSFENRAIRGLQPVFEKISSLANNQGVQSFVENIATGIAYAGIIIVGAANGVEWLASLVTNALGYAFSWTSAIAVIGFQAITAAIPIVLGAVLGLAAGWAVLNAGMIIATGFVLTYSAAMRVAYAAMIAYETAITTVAAAKRVWIAVTSGATIAQTLLAAATWLGVSPILAVAAVIVGVMVAALAIWGLASMNLRNVVSSAFSSIAETTGNAINFMIRRTNDLITLLNKAATSINSVFGTSIGTVEMIGEVDAKGWGKAAGEFVQNFDISKIGNMFKIPEMPGANDYLPPVVTDMANAGADTADNTKGIKDAMEITDEDIKYMRDIAEQEIINRYTTAEVKIEMGGIHNSVSSDMDLDGMVRYINDSLFEAMVSGAEKVHP
ncbi:MAG: hypothetical protein H6Q72_1465 [Firmicutes bacterium]|nr:hypothetical protein [Bacillota bacterium]